MDNSFSVVIPTHDRRGKLLARAIRSIASQTYPYWECIVVDDHSTDSVKDIVLGSGDQRMKYIKLEGPGNRYFARNAGMRAVQNDWICGLDSDDEYLSHYFEIFNDAINEFPDYKVFNCATLSQHNKKVNGVPHYTFSTIRNTFEPKEEGEGHEHFESGNIGQGQFVFHKSILDVVGYLPEARTWWDFSEMAGIKGYGRDLRPLGNPWGEDYYLFYKITRKFRSKPLKMVLYIQHCR